ncbi:MAG: DUF3343 domain-containing protein [Desulfuromonadaceae bacterium]|nr:DUF3343 domain-containing protein [Desulfuromonadaceae bacterium]
MIQHGQLLAVFNSAHRVMKAENILKKCGMDILLIPAPRALSTDCGLAIRYDSNLHNNVMEALISEKLLPDFVYRKDSDVHYERIWSIEDDDNSSS